MQKTISIIIRGKVQGVNFRQGAQEKASALGIRGIVRNLPDKAVKIVATGDQAQLDDLLLWCKEGTSRAEANDAETTDEELRTFPDFRVVK
ncbi:MAG: acylphosphatase [Chitinophagaceae bacterium]